MILDLYCTTEFRNWSLCVLTHDQCQSLGSLTPAVNNINGKKKPVNM